MSLNHLRLWGALNWPNRISLLRLLLLAPFVFLVMNQNRPGWHGWARHAALGVFVIMSVSDVADGMLARRLNARTRLGAILDPLADKALVIFAVVLLSMPDFQVPAVPVENWVAIAAVGKDLWVVVGWLVIYLVTDTFLFRPTLAGKAATFAICVLIPAVLLAPELNRLGGQAGTRLVWGLQVVVTVLCILAVISYTRVGLAFIVQRGKPLDNGDGPESDDPEH